MPRDGWDVAQLVGCMPSKHVILNLIPSTTQTRHGGGGMSITSSLRKLRDRSQVQSYSLLHSRFEVSLGYMRHCPPLPKKMIREKAGSVMAAIREGRRLNVR